MNQPQPQTIIAASAHPAPYEQPDVRISYEGPQASVIQLRRAGSPFIWHTSVTPDQANDALDEGQRLGSYDATTDLLHNALHHLEVYLENGDRARLDTVRRTLSDLVGLAATAEECQGAPPFAFPFQEEQLQ